MCDSIWDCLADVHPLSFTWLSYSFKEHLEYVVFCCSVCANLDSSSVTALFGHIGSLFRVYPNYSWCKAGRIHPRWDASSSQNTMHTLSHLGAVQSNQSAYSNVFWRKLENLMYAHPMWKHENVTLCTGTSIARAQEWSRNPGAVRWSSTTVPPTGKNSKNIIDFHWSSLCFWHWSAKITSGESGASHSEDISKLTLQRSTVQCSGIKFAHGKD